MRITEMQNGAHAYVDTHRQRRRWLAVLGVLAVLVVFVTAYALMMPASTLTADSAEEAETETVETANESTEATAEEATETAALPDGAAVPDGYTEQYTVQDEDNGFTVTVYAPEGVVSEGATLSATLLSESDDAYAAAEEALAADVDEDSDYGFAALDIHFEDADGNEVEPEGDVYVVIDAADLLPEDADADTVTVQHHAESDGDVTVETVADAADETDGVVAVTDDTTVQAAFSVESFSTFTITWSSYFRVTIHYVNASGTEIQGSQTSSISASSGSTYTFSDYAGSIEGYSYAGAHYSSYNGSTVTSMTFSQSTTGGGPQQQTTRTLTLYNGDEAVETLTYGRTQTTVNIYLLYATTVTTADTSSTVSISLYDYTELINGSSYSEGSGTWTYSTNQFMFAGASTNFDASNADTWWNYWTRSGGGVTQGIVSSLLVNGYPQLTGDRYILVNGTNTSTNSTSSLASLFSDTNNEQVTAYEGLNHLFIYDEETGYYSFDSSKNFATIYTNGSSYSTDFTVYSSANTGTSDGASGHPYFLPFNAYGTSESSANYHFGMKITTEFLMPADGRINDEDMTFSFAGDDDVWVYIDGVLILDMGGVHDSNSGSINFGDGTVTVEKVYSISGTSYNNASQTQYIGDLLHDAYKDDAEYISTNLTYNSEDGHWYLNDYTTHDFAFFYLERGAVDSNCAISFNLYTLQQNSLTVGKELSTSTDTTTEMDEWLGDLEYTFRVLKSTASSNTTNTNDLFIAAGTEYDIYNGNNQKIGTGEVASDGTFTLKAGQYAVFTGISEDAGSYYVQELVESEYSAQFGSVSVSVSPSGGNNSLTDSNGATISEQKFSGIISGTMDASGTGYVVFTNRVDTDNLSMLTITKEASDGSEFGEDQTFTIYVEIDGEPLDGTFGDVTFKDGEGTFSVGTTVSIPVLAGAAFTIYEVNGDNYNVVYSAEQTFANANNASGSYTLTENGGENSSVSGEVGDIANTALPEDTTVTDATNATMAVTLTNSSYDFNTSLPIGKTLVGWTDGDSEYTFSFKVEEVGQGGSSLQSSTDDVSAVGTEIAISDSENNTGTVYFNFESDVTDSTYYFKVYEDEPEDTGNVTYDTSYYIVAVTVTSESGIKSASVTGVTKYTADGKQDTSFTWGDTEGVTSLAFTNSLTTSITIKKTDSDGSSPLKDAVFQLYYTVDDTNYYYKNSDGEVSWTETEAEATPLTSDDKGLIPIDGLRMDVTYYLVETKAPDGYQLLEKRIVISWNDNSLTAFYESGSDNLVNSEDYIVVTNTTGAELPATGGSGTTYLTISGLLLVAIAVGGGFATKRLRKSGTTFDR